MNSTATDTAQSVRCLAQDICGGVSQIIYRLSTNHSHQALRRSLRPCKSPRLSDGTWLITSALHDATMKESERATRRKQCTDRLCSSRLAKDRDIVRISAKGPDVLRDPFENGKEIQHSTIRAGVGVCEKTEDPQAVVDRYNGDTTSRQTSAIIGIFRSGAAQIASTMYPTHDRLHRFAIQRSGPNVQRETIFTLRRLAQVKTSARGLYRN